MAERKPFLLRLDPRVFDELQRWAAADLRSLNAQIEFVLRNALAESGRLPGGGAQKKVVGASGGPRERQATGRRERPATGRRER